jgi:uncharacterized protein YbjT (DUF2867 family)
MGRNIGLGLAAGIGAVLFLLSPTAGADPGAPSSYDLGKQAVDDAVRQHPWPPNTDPAVLPKFCDDLLKNVLATGKIPMVPSPPDFISGCQDESRAVLASQ